MKRLLILFVVVLAACSPAATPVPPTPTDPPIDTPAPTQTHSPTATPKPTNTPRPTRTPTPVPTATPVPEPILLSGQGDSVVDLENWSEPFGIAHVTYSGSGNFVVYNYDGDGNQIDLLVNTIGRYDGVVPFDFGVDEHTSRFQVKASGKWQIEVMPMTMARRLDVPGSVEGQGDDVVLLAGYNANPPDLARIENTGDGNFVVWFYSGEGADLAVNEIGDYSGTSILKRDSFLAVIQSDGKWKIEVETK